MITRREFLKLSALATAALGLGYGAGKIKSLPRQNRFLSLYGFLPGDAEVLQSAVAAFNPFVRRDTSASITAKGRWAAAIADAFDPVAEAERFAARGNVNFRFEPLPVAVDSDLLLSDDARPVYDPELDFPSALAELRAALRGRRAAFLFNAVYVAADWLPRRVGSDVLVAVIRNEKGVVDHIPLSRAYRSVKVSGALGKTLLQFQDGMVRAQQASCRNRICEHTGWISAVGDVIACAPNRLLVEIVST